MARPTKGNPEGSQKSPKFTPETVNKLEQAFAIDASIEEACFYAGITKQCFYLWKKKHIKLFDSFEALRNKPILAARLTIVNNIDTLAGAQWYIERKRKKEFSLRSELTGEDGKPLMSLGETAREKLKHLK